MKRFVKFLLACIEHTNPMLTDILFIYILLLSLFDIHILSYFYSTQYNAFLWGIYVENCDADFRCVRIIYFKNIIYDPNNILNNIAIMRFLILFIFFFYLIFRF